MITNLGFTHDVHQNIEENNTPQNTQLIESNMSAYFRLQDLNN